MDQRCHIPIHCRLGPRNRFPCLRRHFLYPLNPRLCFLRLIRLQTPRPLGRR